MRNLSLMIVFILASLSMAEYLFDDQAWTPGSIHGGTGCGGDFTLADAFELEPANGGTIESIEWWLTGADVGNANSAWEVTFYSDEPGSPYNAPGDTLWQKDIYPTIVEISNGDDGLDANYWHASCDLDPGDYLTLDGSTTYWMGFHYTGTEYGVFGGYSYPGGIYSYYYPGQPWCFMSGNLIFALSGTPGTTNLDMSTWGSIKSTF